MPCPFKKGEERGQKNGTGTLTLIEGGFLIESHRKDHQKKGEEGGQKNGTGALTLVEGVFFIEANGRTTSQNKGEEGDQ